MACEIPSNLSGMNKMYNNLGWVVFRGYGKKNLENISFFISTTMNL
jgi:hypothetical protein